MSTAQPITSSDLIGREFFGAYRVVEKLGSGGMASVYLARHEAIDQEIALKVLQPQAAGSDEIVGRFHREAKVIGMLTHPNIVRVLIFGESDSLLFMAMEHVDGEQLDERAGAGELSEGRVIKIMKQVASALAEAHDLGIIHRDLKPENILLTEFRGEPDFVKVLDFGIAKILHDDDPDAEPLTKAGIIYGTPHYLSPEQARAQEIDKRADIYSLGCILYELMCGQRAFAGNNPAQVVRRQAFDDPTPPRQVAPERVSPTMERIIVRAMAKDPADRFDSALEMFDALVAREQELMAEGAIDGRSTYFPGSEVTGSRPLPAVQQEVTNLAAAREEDDDKVSLSKSSAMLMVASAVFVFIVMMLMILWLVITS